MPPRSSKPSETDVDPSFLQSVMRKLEAKRLELGLSQADFVRPADMSDQTWLLWMRGAASGGANPKLSKLLKLLQAYGFDVHVLGANETPTSSLSHQAQKLLVLLDILPEDLRDRIVADVQASIRGLLQRPNSK